jgi:uncharacterized protein (TIGR02268 family)
MSLLLLLFPSTAQAQARSLEAGLPTRQLEFSVSPRPELWVAPGQPLLVLLDAPLAMDRMRQAGAVEGLRRVEVAERSVTLVPGAGLKAGTLVEYTLHFADGQPAAGVTLGLRVDSARAEPEVEVYRGDIPAAALKRQVAALNASLAALRDQGATLSALLTTGLLGPAGVKSSKLQQFSVFPKDSGLSQGDTWVHSATGRMALEMTLTLAPGAPPWVPGEVLLTETATLEPLPVRGVKLVGGPALQPGNTTRLLVEWDTPLEAELTEYTVHVNEHGGARSVTQSVKPLSTRSPVAAPKEKKP